MFEIATYALAAALLGGLLGILKLNKEFWTRATTVLLIAVFLALSVCYVLSLKEARRAIVPVSADLGRLRPSGDITEKSVHRIVSEPFSLAGRKGIGLQEIDSRTKKPIGDPLVYDIGDTDIPKSEYVIALRETTSHTNGAAVQHSNVLVLYALARKDANPNAGTNRVRQSPDLK